MRVIASWERTTWFEQEFEIPHDLPREDIEKHLRIKIATADAWPEPVKEEVIGPDWDRLESLEE